MSQACPVRIESVATRLRGLMARSEIRLMVKLWSAAGPVGTYAAHMNRRNAPDRLVLRTIDLAVHRHVEFREEH